MERQELEAISKRLNDRIREAVGAGDFAGAEAMTATLAKDYVYMIKGLRLVIETLLPYVEERFREGQAKLADETREAIRRKDAEGATRLLDRKDDKYRPLHDFYLKIMATLFNYTYKEFGDAALEGLFRHAAEGQRRGFDKWEGMPVEEFVRTTAFLLNAHLGTLRVEEDGEKFTITQDACGSGGRMMRDGLYDGEKPELLRIKKAQPMTFGRENFPVYCAHCAVWNAILPTEWYGRIHWAFTPPPTPHAPCVLRIYKEARGIPAEFYRAVGQEKPVGASPAPDPPGPGRGEPPPVAG
jgi:hypothetical protein